MRHRFHALCPYFAMFPESFAEKWIAELSKPGDVVLDPFCGRGTTPFQAVLMNRRAVGCDTNNVAFCLTKAKTSPPRLSSLMRRLELLEERFDGRSWRNSADNLPEFFRFAYARRTLQQLLYLRETLKWTTRKTDCMIAALAIGSLHGEADKSQSYFSNQMPRTISTKPAYSVRFWKTRGLVDPPIRDVFAILRQRAAFRYASPLPEKSATVIRGDMRRLSWKSTPMPDDIRCVITSPPYFDVTSFEEDQWLRLWFLGGPAGPTRNRISSDDRHTIEARYWSFIADMWRCLGSILGRSASIVIRIGSSRITTDNIERQLTATAAMSHRHVTLVNAERSAIQNRQTDTFRPGSRGCREEIDCYYRMR